MSLPDSPYPLISILMPVHNAERYIGRSIESVINQTYANWELLVLDDASTDGTAEVVRSYLADTRIRYYPLVKQISNNQVRNIGIDRSQGEYITYLDADDVYYPHMLERLSSVLRQKPEISYVYGFMTSINEKDELISGHTLTLIKTEEGGYTIPAAYNHSWENILLGSLPTAMQSTMIRRSLVEKIGKISGDMTHAADSEYLLRIFLHDRAQVEAVPDYVTHYRIHPTSITKREDQIMQSAVCETELCNRIFAMPNLPLEARALESETYLYRLYLPARLQLLQNRPQLARRIAKMAFTHPKVRKPAWIRRFIPLIIRSWMPAGMDDNLRHIKRTCRSLLWLLMARKNQAVKERQHAHV